jgi:hypothetical protein
MKYGVVDRLTAEARARPPGPVNTVKGAVTFG